MIKLKIVTPDGSIYEDAEVIAVTLPTAAGVITVMDDHETLLSVISPGEIIIKKSDHEVELVVSSGVIQIKPESEVNLMVETAERVEEIDVERAEEARKRAEEYLAQKEDIADVEFARIQAKIQKELARIDLGMRYRKRTIPTGDNS